MSGVTGQLATLAIGKQTAKGTPVATATAKLKFVGGNVDPRRGFVELAETDTTRQQGKDMVVSERIEGSTEHYLRPDDAGLLGFGCLGADAVSGTGPNFTHVETPVNSLPYFTLWKNLGAGALVDQYTDNRIAGLHFRGQAGGVLACTVDWMGLGVVFGATDAAFAVGTQDPLVYPMVTVTKAGSAPGTVESFSLDILNGLSFFQGDKTMLPYDTILGELKVSGSITILFESDSDYRKFHTGTGAGVGVLPTLFTEALNINAAADVNRGVAFDINNVAYQEYSVGPNPGGDAIRVVMGFRAQPAAAIADYIELTVKSSLATY